MKRIPFQSSAVKSTVKGVLLGSAVALPLMAAAFPASAADRSSDVEQLQSQLQELQSKVANLQAEQKASDDTSSEKSSDDFFSLSKGGMTVGNTTFKLGGYVKLDAIYDLDNDMGDSAGNSQVIVGPSDNVDQGNFHMHARQTRVSITSTTSTGMGDIGGYVEGDFFGSGSAFRLRQAYLTWGNWLFGQAWSTFSDFNYGPTLDFYGPSGEIFSRHAQIRYTMNLSSGSNLALALETPQDDGIMVAPGTNAGAHNQFPDAVARYQVSSGPLSFQVAGIARYIKADNVAAVTGDDGVFGWGGDIGASYALPTGTTLMLTGTYGQGITGYQYLYPLATRGDTSVGNAYVDDNGDLKATTGYTGVATISQKLTPTLTTNLIYGVSQMGSLDDAGFDASTAIKREDDIHANLIYTPVDHLMFGIEYIWAHTSLQSGDDGQANRIQFSTQYTF